MKYSSPSKVELLSIAFWVMLGIFPCMVFQTASPVQILWLALLLAASMIFGNHILLSLRLNKHVFSSFSWAGLSGFAFLLLLIPLIFVSSPVRWLYVGGLMALALWIITKYRPRASNYRPLSFGAQLLYLAAAILTVVIINHGELWKMPFVNHVYAPGEIHPDSAFFTAIVATYGGNLSEGAVYEVGTPIKYHVFAYLFPAIIKFITGISAYTAYNSVFNPMLYLLFYLLLIDFSRLVFSNDSNKINNFYYALVPLFFILLTPINPKGILSLDYTGIIWGGPGFISPGGNLASSMGLLLTILCLMAWYQARAFQADRLLSRLGLFAILVMFLLLTKITFFIALAIFTALDQLYLLINQRNKQQFYHSIKLALIFIIALIFNYLLVDQRSSIIAFQYGYLLREYNILNLQGGTLPLLFVMGLFLFWFATRIGIFLLAFNQKLVFKAAMISLSAFFVATLFPLLFSAQAYAQGIVVDKTFDLVQFPRASAAYPSIFAAIAVPIAFLYWKKVMYVFSIFLLVFVGIAYISRLANVPAIDQSETRYYSGYSELTGGEFMAIYPIDNFRSVQIASTGLFKIYSAMDFSDTGYNGGSAFPGRWENIEQLDFDLPVQEKILPLQQDSVRYLLTIKELRQPLDSIPIVYENEAITLQRLY